MSIKAAYPLSFSSLSIVMCLAFSSVAGAQVVPGPADVSRIKPEEKQLPSLQSKTTAIRVPSVAPTAPIPQGAKTIHFVLKNVKIEGSTVFSQEQLRDVYAAYINKDITLDIVYMMAGAITERYRNAGYFLSLAYVPDQSIKEGTIVLKVVEGYIGKVELEKDARQYAVVQSYINRLQVQKPVTSQAVESFLLRLNDLPGHSFSGVLGSYEGAPEGAVKLSLMHAEKKGQGSLSFDNSSSRFLGPNEVSASYSASFLPLQQTNLSILSSVPAKKLNYIALDHGIAIAPDVLWSVAGSMTRARPGFTLEPFEIESDATFVSTSFRYQWVRQRQENLALTATLDARNSNTDLLDTPFTRDRIRAVRLNANYDRVDEWQGYNAANFTLSHGINGLGSSKKGDTNLSRDQAEPDFTKAELALTRLQSITENWSVLIGASAQRASGPLFSAEEFGYGGQSFGRAFDSSEITGDNGVAGSLELRYGGVKDFHSMSIQPYVFYDIGKIWNDDIAQVESESASSAGLGVRINTESGISGNLGLALPLTRDITTPIYGGQQRGPRVLLQISKGF